MLGLEIVMVAALACGGDGGTSTSVVRTDGGCQCGHKSNVVKKTPKSDDTQVVVTSQDGSGFKRFVLPRSGSGAYVLQDGKLKALPEGKLAVTPQGKLNLARPGKLSLLPQIRTYGDFKLAVPRNVRVKTLDGGDVKTLRVQPGTILRIGEDGQVLVPKVKRSSSRAILI
jgi:hypothetical protein